MKSANPELEALLNSTRQFCMADLYTIATVGGDMLRYASGDFDVTLDGNRFTSRGPLVSRGPIRTMVGLEVDTLTITIATANPADQLNGQPFITAALDGALDGATVLLAAADTFRAAAADQLQTWGERVGVPTIRSDREGADPAAVAFDAVKAGAELEADVVVIDTAGHEADTWGEPLVGLTVGLEVAQP